jgi:hypothetical protein
MQLEIDAEEGWWGDLITGHLDRAIERASNRGRRQCCLRMGAERGRGSGGGCHEICLSRGLCALLASEMEAFGGLLKNNFVYFRVYEMDFFCPPKRKMTFVLQFCYLYRYICLKLTKSRSIL